MTDTNIIITKNDVGKNLYRKTTYYTLMVTQDVLAKDKDEADNLFIDNGGINHSEITNQITDQNNGVETLFVDADYQDSSNTDYIGKVVEDPSDEDDIYIDDLEPEFNTNDKE